MKILKIMNIRGEKNEFDAIFVCEFCGHTLLAKGYDDTEYFEKIIPALPCPKCGKFTKPTKLRKETHND